MVWNYLQVEIRLDDRLLVPQIGPGGLTRAQAHAVVQATLDAIGLPIAATWRRGARDDTVYHGLFAWAIYEADDPTVGAHAWLADFAQRLRAAGMHVGIAALS